MNPRGARLPGSSAELDEDVVLAVIGALKADRLADGEGLRSGDLAARMHLHRTTIGRLLRELERGGIVERAEGQRWRYSGSLEKPA